MAKPIKLDLAKLFSRKWHLVSRDLRVVLFVSLGSSLRLNRATPLSLLEPPLLGVFVYGVFEMLLAQPRLPLNAVCIVGGGAKNIVSCGQVQFLVENQIRPDMVFAASGGGLTAAMWAQGDLDVLHDIWMTISNADVRTFNPFLIPTKRACVYDFKPLWGTLRKYITRERLAKSLFDVWLSVTSLETKSVQRYNLRDLPKDKDPIELLVASASISGFVEPVQGKFVDGGIMDDYGIEAACNSGARSITVLHPSHPGNLAEIDNLLDAIETGITLQMWATYQIQLGAIALLPEDCRPKIWEVIPENPPPIKLFNFDYTGLNRASLIQEGYDSAQRTFDLLQPNC